MRAQDRMAVCELQEAETATLKALFAHDSRVDVRAGDGYALLRSLLPPKFNGSKIGRGLLIDPPYEARTRNTRTSAALAETARWPQATCAVWFPIKQRRTILHFLRKATALPVKSAMTIEFWCALTTRRCGSTAAACCCSTRPRSSTGWSARPCRRCTWRTRCQHPLDWLKAPE